MEQPVINALVLITKYIGLVLIVIVLFWRFLMPTKINHLPIGVQIYNKDYNIDIFNVIIHLYLVITLIIFLEKPDFFDSETIKFRQSLRIQAVYVCYAAALFFFIHATVSAYRLIYETPRTIPLTQEIKDNAYQINSGLYEILKVLLSLARIIAILSCVLPIFIGVEAKTVSNKMMELTIFFICTLALYVLYLILTSFVVYSNISKLDTVKKAKIKSYLYAVSCLICVGIPLYISAAFKISIIDQYFVRNNVLNFIKDIFLLGIFSLLVWGGYRLWILIKSKLIYLNWLDIDEKERI